MFAKTLFVLLPLLGSAIAASTPNRLATRQDSASKIQSASRPDLCVTVMGGQAVAGASIHLTNCSQDANMVSMQSFTCGETEGQQPGQHSVAIKLECAPNLCIDRGCDESENGSGLQLQECIENFSTQTWQRETETLFSYFGEPKKCLDMQQESGFYWGEGESYPSEKFLQTWDCADGNTNQEWNLIPAHA